MLENTPQTRVGADGGQIAPLEKEIGHPTATPPGARNSMVLEVDFHFYWRELHVCIPQPQWIQ